MGWTDRTDLGPCENELCPDFGKTFDGIELMDPVAGVTSSCPTCRPKRLRASDVFGHVTAFSYTHTDEDDPWYR